MIAVSDTTPLRHLIAIGQENLLHELFTTLLIPRGVQQELTDARTPDRVRRRVSAISWIEVRTVTETQSKPFPSTLHRGEREAILLAELLQPDVLLIDEQLGRTVALNRGVPVSGTLGVLERADLTGLVSDFPQLLKDLKQSGFFITPSLEELLLRRHMLRHRN